MERIFIAGVVTLVLVLVAGGGDARAEDGLTVPRSGVGTDVQDRELVGESDTFEEGREIVFWTLVDGGADGDAVDHVWIREGEEVVVVGLAVGGPRWRTWSRKTLHPGSAGSWKVEARDRDGNVLAEATFTCTPAED